MAALAATALLAAGGCDDAMAPAGPATDEVGVVVNSIEISLTIFPTESPTETRTLGLAPEGSPVSVAARGGLAAVPLGVVPALAVADLGRGVVARTVPLPAGSGATGAAFVNDAVVVVANPGLGTVSPVNVRSGDVGDQVPVGRFPQGVFVVGERVVVVNSELGPDFLPAGPSSVTVLDAATLTGVGTVTLSGENAGSGAVGPNGLLWVVHSGRFGEATGSVSAVDVEALAELAHYEGFGEFPFAAAFGPGGRLHVGSFSYGLAVWDPSTGSFLRPPEDAVAPGGVPSVSGVAFDRRGRLHTLHPDCREPGAVQRLTATYEVELSVPTGVCPVTLAFTSVPAG